jgi:carboxyl-terminal processing protease
LNKNFGKGLLLGFVIALAASTFFYWMMLKYYTQPVNYYSGVTTSKATDGDASSSSSALSYAEKMNIIMQYIDAYYYADYDLSDVYEDSYEGLVDGLGDKYSCYYTEEDYKTIEESTTGNYYGIGAYVSLSEEYSYPMITSPIPGSPAEEAGLLAGDILIEADGTSLYEMDLDSAVALIKGEEGTDVTLTIYREGEADYLYITVTRGQVSIQTVSYELLDDNVGYIYVSQFDSVTVDQFDNAVDDLLEQGMTSLVIDLRNNPGGLLYSATSMLDRLLPANQLLVYTEDKQQNKESIYSEDDEELDMPIAVIVNGSSASASEVFTGCLRDYDKITIVGEKSFGKGIVQTVFTLPDNSKLKLTTAYYYSPNGINIHGTGIEPDIEVEDDADTEEDEQLEAAVEAVKVN